MLPTCELTVLIQSKNMTSVLYRYRRLDVCMVPHLELIKHNYFTSLVMSESPAWSIITTADTESSSSLT